MPNTSTLSSFSPPLDVPAIFADARAARTEYETLVNALDSCIAPSTWRRVAAEIHRTGALMLLVYTTNRVPDGCILTLGLIQCHVDRANDAEHHAEYAERMASAARSYPCVEVVS